MTTENEKIATPATVKKAVPKKVAPKKAAPKKAVTKKSTAIANKVQQAKKAPEQVSSFSSRRVWPD